MLSNYCSLVFDHIQLALKFEDLIVHKKYFERELLEKKWLTYLQAMQLSFLFFTLFETTFEDDVAIVFLFARRRAISLAFTFNNMMYKSINARLQKQASRM